jgi:hypothetical protein
LSGIATQTLKLVPKIFMEYEGILTCYSQKSYFLGRQNNAARFLGDKENYWQCKASLGSSRLPVFTRLQGILTSYPREVHFLKTNILPRSLFHHVEKNKKFPGAYKHGLVLGKLSKKIFVSHRNFRKSVPNNSVCSLQTSQYGEKPTLLASKRERQFLEALVVSSIHHTLGHVPWVRERASHVVTLNCKESWEM